MRKESNEKGILSRIVISAVLHTPYLLNSNGLLNYSVNVENCVHCEYQYYEYILVNKKTVNRISRNTKIMNTNPFLFL